MRSSVPVHLVLGPPAHGVSILARQVAAVVRAPVVDTWGAAARHDRVHVHLTDRLLRAASEDPIARLSRLSKRATLTVTLHDVPQRSDGSPFRRRVAVYRDVLATAHGWMVSSEHERALVHEHLAPTTAGRVAPLPAPRARGGCGRRAVSLRWPPGRTAAVFGFVYPGKGHLELLRAAASIRDRAEVTVMALGAVAPGHQDLVDDLTDAARALGVRFVVTGHLDDRSKEVALRRTDVAVCGHRNVSASGSMNEWLAVGRRPLVREGRYAREMEALRPGCHRLYADADLADAVLAALEDPGLTRLPAGSDTRPHLEDTARDYLAWWAST